MSELGSLAEIQAASKTLVEALMRGDVGEEKAPRCRLQAVMLPDGSKAIEIIQPDTGITHRFDLEFADAFASWLESPSADWSVWSEYAASWARSLRAAIEACAQVGRH